MSFPCGATDTEDVDFLRLVGGSLLKLHSEYRDMYGTGRLRVEMGCAEH